MSSKKLICSAVLLMVAFFAVFSSGCGGGGSDAVEAVLEKGEEVLNNLLDRGFTGLSVGLNGYINLLGDNESKDNQPKVLESDDLKPEPSENKNTELRVVVYEAGTLNSADGTITPVSGATVVVSMNSQTKNGSTNSAGLADFNLDDGVFVSNDEGNPVANYTVDVTKTGYRDFSAEVQIYEHEQKELRVDLVKIQKASGVIYARDAQTNAPISDVNVDVFSGWDVSGDVTPVFSGTTSGDGSFVFLSRDSGYYTIVMTKPANNTRERYIETRYNETFAEGNENLSIGYLSKIMPSGQFRVVLSWGVYPSDLDAHLYGKGSNGQTAHVFYPHDCRQAEIDGKVVSLDRDDVTSYGPETITFEITNDAKYEYFIHWYAPRGSEYDWSRTEAKVELYRGSSLVYTYTVPPAPDGSKQYRYWRVFKIENGIVTGLNTYTSTFDNIVGANN